MSSPRCSFPLGNGRFIQVKEWQGELRVDIREWEGDVPTKKGISLNLMQFKNFLNGMSSAIEPVMKNKRAEQDEKFHLGAGVYITVTKDNPCVDIRKYWMNPPNQDESLPTKKGICLRPTEYDTLMKSRCKVEDLLPELKDEIPCYMNEDHQNQEGMLRCKMCNPDDYKNWL